MSFSQLLAAGKSMVGMTRARSPYRMRAENLLPKFESQKNPFTPKPEARPGSANASLSASAVKIAPMETFPLFDADLNPVALPKTPVAEKTNIISEPAELVLNTSACEAQEDGWCGSRCEPPHVAAPHVAAPHVAAPHVAAPHVAAPHVAARHELPSQVGIAHQRRVMQPEPSKGLVDGSPLGLKSGTPARAPLPAPVVAPPTTAGKPQKPSTGSAPSAAPDKSSQRIAAVPQVPVAPKRGLMAKVKNYFGFGPKPVNNRNAVQAELSLDRVKVMRNDLSDADLELVSKTPEKPVIHAMRVPGFAGGESGSLGRMASRIIGAGQSLVR